MTETPIPKSAYVESLLVWIHQRPDMYCMLAGELDLVLANLHMVWAKIADREREYFSALTRAGQTPKGLLTQSERHRRVSLRAETTQRVLAFWSSVDELLDIKERVPGWYGASANPVLPGQQANHIP